MSFSIIPFRIRSAILDDAVVVSVEGELDLHTRPQFARELLAARGRGTGTVVVDLSHVTFIDSTAVAVVVTIARELREDGEGSLVVVTDSPAARRTFEVTGLDRFVRLERSLNPVLAEVTA